MNGCFFARKPPPEFGFLLRVLDCSDLLKLADLYGEARDGLKSPEMMDAVNRRIAEVVKQDALDAARIVAMGKPEAKEGGK